jgi:hypothetical protein
MQIYHENWSDDILLPVDFYVASSGRICLYNSIFDEGICFIRDIDKHYKPISEADVPEDIVKAFRNKFDDPFTEIEYIRWLKNVV